MDGQPGIVEVSSGRLAGVRRRELWVFSGVPYAGRVSGGRRWRAPQAPEPWSGVREAAEFGPVAPQTPTFAGTPLEATPQAQDEDCLTLNVWTPGLDGARRPVMVWIHGGSFTSGSGTEAFYRGGHFAGRGDVVLVTLNYRLGALGFLAHPALADEDGSVGNWGLRDQIAALGWVRDHIAAFGGDPGNVTVFGESAGGMSVAALMTMPAAKGLFRRAVVQSGPPMAYRSDDEAYDLAERVAVELEVPLERGAFEAVDAQRLVETVTAMSTSGSTGSGIPLPCLPFVDGRWLPAPITEAFASGAAADVPLVIGTTRDEMTMFTLRAGDPKALTEERVAKWLAMFCPHVEDPRAAVHAAVALRERRGQRASLSDAWNSMLTEIVFRAPTLRMADAHAAAADAGTTTHAYLFTWPSPLFEGMFGSFHALEVPFVFGTVRNPGIAGFTGGGDASIALSDRMMDDWQAFARDGGVAGWTTWDPTTRPTRVYGPWREADGGSASGVDDPVRMVDDPLGEEVALVWKG